MILFRKAGMGIALMLFAMNLATDQAAAFDFFPRHASHSEVASQAAPAAEEVDLHSKAIVAFSPNGEATSVVVDAIGRARSQILVQAYSFTSKPILAALARAEERGVDVEVIVDRSNDKGRYTGATYMRNHGVPVWVDDSVRIAHNKVMIFDRKSVLTGSFNFSAAAQKSNAENVLLVENSPELAALYMNDWKWRQSLSRRLP